MRFIKYNMYKKLTIALLFFSTIVVFPHLVYAESLTGYSRTPSGSPINDGTNNVHFTWTLSGASAQSMRIYATGVATGNDFGTCFNSYGAGSDDLTLPIDSYSSVHVVSYINLGCSNNNTPLDASDTFVVQATPITPLASTTAIINASQDVFNGMMIFGLSAFFTIWFFRRKV